MAYDLLIKNGLIVDGSGAAGVSRRCRGQGRQDRRDRQIVRPGDQTIEADGRAVAPGFIDNHCHYDAQVTWDPLCTFSPEHGATSVIFGNCSLSLAPCARAPRNGSPSSCPMSKRSRWRC